jgi:hypothetical protein
MQRDTMSAAYRMDETQAGEGNPVDQPQAGGLDAFLEEHAIGPRFLAPHGTP